MGLFFTYIIKSTICLALFYLFYRLLLSKDTFHRFNRVALLSLMFLSVIIPFIKISTGKESLISLQGFDLEQLFLMGEQSSVESIQSLGLQTILLLYIVGTLFFLFRLLYSTLTIINIIRSGEIVKVDKPVTLILTKLPITPFSWLKYIVISSKDWEENSQEILAHEMAHIRYHHCWDVLIAGLVVIFHWFNPAAWLLKQELQNLHEYEADESVINQGIDAKKYQLLLIKKAVGSQRFTSMANSFNHSKLKKRITMMLKSKSNSRARLKYLFVLPLTAIAIAAFAHPEISHELDKISSTKISEIPLIRKALPNKNEMRAPLDTIIMDADLEADIRESVVKAIDKSDLDEKVKRAIDEVNIAKIITVALQDLKIEEKVNEAINQSNIEEKINETIAKQGTYYVFDSGKISQDVYILIDGMESTQEDIDRLDPQTIESVSVLKTKELIKQQYGKDVDGVILIKTK